MRIKTILIALVAVFMAVTACGTVSTNAGRNEYTAGAAQTIFNYTFKIYADTDLSVYLTPVGQEPDDSADITTAYTVAGAGDDAGGSITLNSGTTSGDLVTIVSTIPTNRTIDYQFNGDFRPNVVNNDFDRAVSLVKQLENTSINTLKYQNSFQGGAGTLPDPVAGNVIGYDGLAQLTNLVLGVDGNSWDGLADLGDNSIGKGSDLVAHTGTSDTVTEAIDRKVATVGDVMTGYLEFRDNTNIPGLLFTDETPSPDTSATLDMSSEVIDIKYSYRGGGIETPFSIDTSTDTVNVFGGRVLTTADEGTGNGLDADTVDGQDAAEFAPVLGGAVAWINLDGSTATTPAGTTGIRDSYCVNTVERTALGKFTVTMCLTMANTTYIVTANAALSTAPSSAQFSNVFATNKTTTTFDLWVVDSNGTVFEDAAIIDAVVFGDQ